MLVDLLHQLNAEKYPMYGYADNLAMVVVGKWLNNIAELMQRGLRKIGTWFNLRGRLRTPRKQRRYTLQDGGKSTKSKSKADPDKEV